MENTTTDFEIIYATSEARERVYAQIEYSGKLWGEVYEKDGALFFHVFNEDGLQTVPFNKLRDALEIIKKGLVYTDIGEPE
jgi:hypothetical protein